MGFLDNKLQATIDVFKNETDGLVAQDTKKLVQLLLMHLLHRKLGSMEVYRF